VLLKVLSQEYPSLQTSHIDVSLSEEGWQPLLAAEINTPGNGRVICLRHGRRWGRHYERLETSVSAMPGGGIYLVTGGLGGLGYTLSKRLLADNAAGLILTGRVALPPRAAWDAGDLEAGVKARIEKIRELESRGCRVLYSHCDLTDVAAVRELVASSEAVLGGRISGVVHAAGIADGESHGGIDTLTQQDYEKQFGPKVQGLEVLQTVLGDRALEFFAATSSLSTVLGGIGFGAYAPANAYMDAYITSGVGTGSLKHWISICFDGLEYGDKTGGGITGGELAEVWRRIMSVRHLPQVVVSVSDLQLRLQQWVNREVAVAEGGEAMAAGDDKASEDDITASLIGLWEQFFGKQGITAEDDFFEIGGNSLKALTMMGRIHKLFNVEVPVKTFFDNSTITLLAAQMNTLMSAGNAGRKEYTAIPSAPLKPYYALSSAQKRLYFLYEMDKDSIAYNLPQVVMLEGALDVAKISLAFNQLLARHENLRTFFEVEDGVPVQKIAAPVTCQIPVVKATAEEVPAVIHNFIRPFDLRAAPLIRMALVAIGSRQHILMVDVHHIIMDGVSENILINDFMALYQEETLPPLQLQYKDFAEWQQEVASQPWMSVQRDFWMREFEEVPTPLELPYDYARPAAKDQEGHIISFDIDTILTGHLKQLAEAEKTTLFMVLLAAYNILLARVSGQDDVVVGTPVAGRHNSDVEQVMGMFVNTLPLRNQVSGGSSFRELLAAVKAKTLSCFDNQDYQYEALISDLALLRDAGRNPLFDAMFVFQNYEQSTLELPGLTLKPYSTGHAVAKFDMTLSAFEHDGKLLLSMEYATSLFKEATIQRFVTCFVNILTAITAHPQALIKDLVIIPAEEAHRLLYEWNNTATDYPSDKSLVELFEQQAQQTPDHIAVEFNEERVTYRQLNHRSGQLARHLVHHGVAPGDIVGLMMERSTDLIVGMLGIMKAGGAYLPLDATYPEEHIRNMLEECRVKTVLTEIPHHEEAPLHALPEVTAAHTAYIIYTSGSTGKPKGVMVPHRPVVNLAWSQRRTFQITEAEKILQFSTICFDASVEQIWLALLSGATLVMVSREVILDNALFNQYLRDHAVTHLHATPSFLESVAWEDVSALKRIIAGGEACPVTLAEKCGGVAAFYNEYGPTETTVTSIEYAVTGPMPDKTYVPIGRPVHNTRVYILGEQLELLPAGARGKLYIGGDGLASGYVNDPELTARKFLWHPLLPEERIYDTGDYARWLPDGQLEFLGRADEQIKIRGYRVELGEIAARLRQHEEVQDSIVIADRQGQHTVLTAYYIPVHGAGILSLDAYMREQLPAYMIPAHFIKMEQFPVNRNGKIDRKALPLVESAAGAEFISPLGDTAEMLANIWSEVLSLNREKIGANSTFFELGGNSLLLIKLQVRMKERLGINVAVAELFTYSSVAALAAFLDNGNVAVEQFEKTVREEVEGLKNMIDIFK
ncbi:amino acid adenylation domain-containing protein, partial [Chitinophaga eiseniae]